MTAMESPRLINIHHTSFELLVCRFTLLLHIYLVLYSFLLLIFQACDKCACCKGSNTCFKTNTPTSFL